VRLLCHPDAADGTANAAIPCCHRAKYTLLFKTPKMLANLPIVMLVAVAHAEEISKRC
jgi:hypothetical protein